MAYVHVRESERLCPYGDHRLEPLGSRAYPRSGNLGNFYPATIILPWFHSWLNNALPQPRGL